MLSLTTKNRQLVELFNGLQAVKDLQGVRFGLIVSKNIRIIQQELNDIDEASKPTDAFLELSEKANKLHKDEEALIKLEDDNSKIVEERKAQLKGIDKLLEGDVKVELHTIGEDLLPEDITAAQITGIDTLLK
tara:strand:- start:143 stop:541 length:399 start_codon:yes stop_codon:yes gene_type:complete